MKKTIRMKLVLLAALLGLTMVAFQAPKAQAAPPSCLQICESHGGTEGPDEPCSCRGLTTICANCPF